MRTYEGIIPQQQTARKRTKSRIAMRDQYVLYSCSAPMGQRWTHCPQSMHFSSSTVGASTPFCFSASTGQALMAGQRWFCGQRLVSTFTAILCFSLLRHSKDPALSCEVSGGSDGVELAPSIARAQRYRGQPHAGDTMAPSTEDSTQNQDRQQSDSR